MAVNETYAQNISNKYVSRFVMGNSFDSYSSVIEYSLKNPDINDEYKTSDALVQSLIQSMSSEQIGPKRRDTSIGGNDTINCYYQFNENDDLVHPINRVGAKPHQGLGRVYNEIFDEQQQILYMSFGVPDYTNIGKFLDKAYDTNLTALMNTGETSLAGDIGNFLGTVVGTVILFPFYPIKFAAGLLLGDFSSPSKYYDFKPTMSLYYKQVNVILAHLAVNMNISAAGEKLKKEDYVGMPQILKDHGLDILTILSKKYYYNLLGEAKSLSADAYFEKAMNDKNYEKNLWEGKGMFETAKAGAAMGLTEAVKFIGFRIEKSVSSSEQASNNTKETELSKLINGQVSAGKDRSFNLATMKDGFAGDAIKFLDGILSGAAGSMNLEGGLEVLKGSGYIDIPEVWESSTFSKSYTFDFQLRAPMGDKFSIFYSLYVPLAMLLAGAFPRSVGQNSYTSPFIVRAFSKGMFAIPLGIVDSISITRGAPEYGWSRDLLPTEINISMSIKDLSPVMHMAMMTGGLKDTVKEWFGVFGQNSSFQEYLLTLSSTNIAERTLAYQLAKRRVAALMKISSNNVFNPIMAAYSLTNTRIGNLLTDLNPISRLPGRVPKPEG